MYVVYVNCSRIVEFENRVVSGERGHLVTDYFSMKVVQTHTVTMCIYDQLDRLFVNECTTNEKHELF